MGARHRAVVYLAVSRHGPKKSAPTSPKCVVSVTLGPSRGHERMNWRPNLSTRRVAGAAFALALGAGGGTGAQAAFPNQLPFMCFNTAHTFHQTSGPTSFFTAEDVQEPTSFQENAPTSKPTVTIT